MNAYRIYDENNYSTILYKAFATTENHVRELAEEAGIDLTELVIEIDSKNITDEIGRPYSAKIFDAQVK